MIKCVLTFSVFLLIFATANNISPAQAVVVQSGSSAMRNDVFVKDSNAEAQRKQRLRDMEKRRKEIQREQEKRKKEAEVTAKKAADNAKKAAEIAAKNINKPSDTSVPEKMSVAEPRKIKEEIPVNKSDSNLKAIKDSGPNYTKSYASKLFKTLSGYITVEQANLPRRIVITKGSTLQLNLKNEPDTFWNVEVDPKVLKIVSNKAQDGQWVVVIDSIGSGSSSIIMDYISTKTSNYKVLTTKKSNIWVN